MAEHNRFEQKDGSLDTPALLAALLNKGQGFKFSVNLLLGIKPTKGKRYTAQMVRSEYDHLLRQQFKKLREFPPFEALEPLPVEPNPEDN